MVLYTTRTTERTVTSYTATSYDSTSSTTATSDTSGPYDNYYEESIVYCGSNGPSISVPLPKEKPVFERVMKARNTDGEVRVNPVFRPMRLVSRGNIGVRNYARHH